MMYFPKAIQDAKKHARDEYPKESCGLVVNGEYVPCFNYASLPLEDFIIAGEDFVRAELQGGVQLVIHSHPNGPMYPSERDMQGQVQTNVPWAIIGVDEDRISEPFFWGDTLDIAPMVGREFRHGVSDCYNIIRDSFRLGKEGMAGQGMEWPFPPITLPVVPRDDSWWDKEDVDLYSSNFGPFGFVQIDRSEVKPGDVFLTKIKSEKLNHGGVYVGNDLILHHLPNRLSRREPFGLWGKAAYMWIRYEGPGSDVA